MPLANSIRSTLALLLVTALACAQTSWTQARLLSAGRLAVAMCYDDARARVVMVAGKAYAPGATLDTWEWDGNAWHLRGPAVSPGAREGHAIAYDSARRRVVLFGGSSTGYLSDTWEWDGDEWSQRTPASGSPPPRSVPALAFDAARGRAVLFGGYSQSVLSDTWEWDGTSWIPRNPATKPAGRSSSAMTFDSLRGRLVLFGGAGSSLLSDTWEWDGATWTQRSPSTNPPARAQHGLAFDSGRGRVVVFGGSGLSDTWEYDGTRWTASSPAMPPAARNGHGFAYDAGRARTVMFGGYDNTFGLSDTWTWDGASWVLRSSSTSPNAFGPLAFDLARSRVVMVAVANHDIWEWDGSSWSQRAAGTKPPLRIGFAITGDHLRGRIVLFGGVTPLPQTRLNDCWEWDGTVWTQRSSTTPPPARNGCALAYDLGRGRVVLFGGTSAVSRLADTWEWDGNTWYSIGSAAGPTARQDHAMAYDAVRGRTVLFGGTIGTGATTVGDTWEYDGSSWLQRNPPTSPSPRSGHSMTWDLGRGRIVLFGGGSGSASRETWEWDGTTWSLVGTPTAPAGAATLSYHVLRGHSVLVSGQLATWLYGSTDSVVPAATTKSGSACAGTNGPPVLTSSVPLLGTPGFAIDVLSARGAAPCAFGLSSGFRALALGSGCSLYLADPVVVLPAATSISGFASIGFPVPGDLRLRGASVFAQAFVLDPLGAFAGLSVTAARGLTLGH